VVKSGLSPVVDDDARFLILGTLPGDRSLAEQRYYSDPRNQFWRLLAMALDSPCGETYEDRLSFLANQRIAIWDVLESATRPGSTDRAITQPKPNEFGQLFRRFPRLRRVGFNGTSAATLWRRHVTLNLGILDPPLTTRVLPSSSGVPGRHVLSPAAKAAAWRAWLLAP